ncbi:MAG: transporter substrate-binding domain-containing protein [Rhodoferax sp.]|nr:MAG: transporter substrate-binding domain-containing protein [Rhodoferax sp.]
MRLLLACLLLCGIPQAFALVIGVYELSPHMVAEGHKEPSGAVVDFAREVFGKVSELGPLEWRCANFARSLRELEAGQIDVVFMVAKNEQRSKLFRYSSVPLFETRSAVITLKGSKLAPLTTLEQLRGARLGHANGSIIPDYLKALDVDVQPIAGDDYFNRGLKMVELKRFDAYFAPTLTNAQYTIKKYEGMEALSVQPLPVEPLALYAVFSKTLDEKTFARLDSLISANLGRYKVLLAPYIR